MGSKSEFREFHLFAGIGGGIYGGELLGHRCCGGVEINEFAQSVLRQRQKDGWLPKFDLYGDIFKLNGEEFKGKFDVLCGGFPCQAFSTAAHGKNIAEKNIWAEMFRFAQESDAPIVFGENVAFKAINKAKIDLESVGYAVQICKLSCSDLGANHQRNRFWLLAVKDYDKFDVMAKELMQQPKLTANVWANEPYEYENNSQNVRGQLTGVGNAQSPFVAASAFRILTLRHINHYEGSHVASQDEIDEVFNSQQNWICKTYGEDFGLVHTPTTMANYSAPSMMKHQGCRNFVKVFSRPNPSNAEYLMGFPPCASSPAKQNVANFQQWKESST